MVGDVAGAPGRSLYVRLFETERGRIGNWVDAATGEHGDLVDLIRLNQRHGRLSETIDEAEKFLSLPSSVEVDPCRLANQPPARVGSPTAARRLFAASKPLAGTLAATYLAARGITRIGELAALRFHPRCYYRANEDDLPGTTGNFPAVIATVTDCGDVQTGTHRTWLDPNGSAKATVASPRRAMGNTRRFPRQNSMVMPAASFTNMTRSIPDRAVKRPPDKPDAHRVFRRAGVSAMMFKHIALWWWWKARPLPLISRRTHC
jgi:hypothetical protein